MRRFLLLCLIVASIVSASCADEKHSPPESWACTGNEQECSNDCPVDFSAKAELDCDAAEVMVSIKVENIGDVALENLQIHSQYKTEGQDENFLPESDFSSPGPGIVDYFHTIPLLEAGESAIATFIRSYENADRMRLEGAIVEDIHLCIPDFATLTVDDEIYYCD